VHIKRITDVVEIVDTIIKGAHKVIPFLFSVDTDLLSKALKCNSLHIAKTQTKHLKKTWDIALCSLV
jgi:hypothetical protein